MAEHLNTSELNTAEDPMMPDIKEELIDDVLGLGSWENLDLIPMKTEPEDDFEIKTENFDSDQSDEELLNEIDESYMANSETNENSKPEFKSRRGRKRKRASSGQPDKTRTTMRYDRGEIVFAQIRGFTPWPARVEEVHENGGNKKLELYRYKVFFFGTHDSGVCKAADISPYTKERTLYMKQRYHRIGFHKAIEEMETNPDIVPPPPKPIKTAEEGGSDSDPIEHKQKRKILTGVRRTVQPGGILPRTKFTSREFFFGEFYDAGVRECDLKIKVLKPIFCRRKEREGKEGDFDEMSNDQDFEQTMEKVLVAVAGLNSLPPRKRSRVLGKFKPSTKLPAVPKSSQFKLDYSKASSSKDDQHKEDEEDITLDILAAISVEMENQMKQTPFKVVQRTLNPLEY